MINEVKALEMIKERYNGIRIIRMIMQGHRSSTNIALKVYGKDKVQSKKQIAQWYIKSLTQSNKVDGIQKNV